ncbi:hypothetical protein ACCQ08_03065 [Comamonas sp. SY3]|uniref:hypothetical protein n=1 Tax=Comamonas sp. SY3 TaxID=3243601 RepID=UPI0035948E2F
MQNSDFFTRLILQNHLGPNMATPGNAGGSIESYACAACGEEHIDQEDAKSCCPPSVIFKCRVCRSRYEEEDDAEDCCPGVANGQALQCPVCLKGADSFLVAADCCLHTHPTMTAYGRQLVAEAVSRGTPWPEAVAANINH